MPDEPIDKEFPCPNCHSTNRFIGTVAEHEKAKGTLPPDIPEMGLESKAVAVVPPNPQLVYVGQQKPGGIAYYDICLECGTRYCFKIVERDVIVSAVAMAGPQGQQGPQPGMPRPMPNDVLH